VDKGVWKEAVGEDAYKEIVGSCDRYEGGVYTTKRKSIPFVERRERGGKRVCKGTVEEGLYPAIKVTTNSAGVLCGEEGWEEEDGSRLLIFE